MSCNITGTLYSPNGTPLANSGVLFEVLTDGAARTAVHVPYRVQSFFTTDDNGLLDADIETPSSGSWQYRMTIHENGATYDFYLSSTAVSLTIDEVLVLAGQAGSAAGTPAAEFLNGLYTAVSGADDGKMLETLGGDLTLVDAPDGAAAVAAHELAYDHGNIPATADAAWLTAAAARVADGDDVATRDTDGTAGNLTVLDAAGNAVDAGYAASQSPTASSVVQRQSTGQIKNDISSADNTDAIRGSSVVGRGIYGTSNNVAGVEGYSASGSGVVAASQAGTYAIETKSGSTQVSGIRRVDGVLEFVGASAATNRAAQRTELGLGTAALAATGDFDAAGAAAAAQAAAVQRANHTGTQLLATISDAGTMAAQATTSYYAKTDFSAAPTAAEPLKADGSGKLRVEGLGIGGAPGSSHRINIVGNSSSITVGVSMTDQRVGYTRQWLMKAADGDYSWIDVTASNAIRIYIKGSTGLVGIGTASPSTQLHTNLSSAVTNSASDVFAISHETSGTAAAGFGAGIGFKLESSTTVAQDAARLAASWIVATHATRTGRLALSAYDYNGAREGVRIDSDGSAPLVGFYGHEAAAQQVLATGAGAAVDDVIAALQALGLVKQS